MSETYSVGQPGRYLYKLSGEEFTIDATIVNVNGEQIEIEFINPGTKQSPGGYPHRRVLRSKADRARFTTDLSYEVRRKSPGPSMGNQNATKTGPHRMLITLSLKDDLLVACATWLEQQGKPLDTLSLKEMAYEAMKEKVTHASPPLSHTSLD